MNLLSYLYRQSWKLLLLATIAGVISGLSGAALAAVISRGVAGGVNSQLSMFAGLFFGLCLAHLVFKSFSEIALLHLTQATISHLRVDLSRKLLATPLKKLHEMGKPGLLVILTKDIDSFTMAFQWLPIAFCDVVIIASCLGYLAWLSWQMFALVTVFFLIGLFGFQFLERFPQRTFVKVRDSLDVLYQHFRDLIEGSKELQLNAQRGVMFVDRVIAPEAQDFKRLFSKSMVGYTWLINVGVVLFYLVIGLVLFVVPTWLELPAEILTTTTLTLLFLVRPISELVIALPVVRQAAIALEKIQQLDKDISGVEPPRLATVSDPDPFASSATPAGQPEWQLELKGVCHHYPRDSDDSQFMLGPVDLTIHPGEILFIVGGNGSGKTTLAMVILGLFEPDAGVIELNGVPVTTANLEHYRQHFSAVFADFHLFEQLLDTDQQSLSERASHYVNVLGMSHKVRVVDGKFSTISLSTGQRKRLALVSSYLEDRPIYLFDEWAADQDPVFKRVFYTELLPELKSRGKTVIIITHDDAYFSHADRIIRLEDGHAKSLGAADTQA